METFKKTTTLFRISYTEKQALVTKIALCLLLACINISWFIDNVQGSFSSASNNWQASMTTLDKPLWLVVAVGLGLVWAIVRMVQHTVRLANQA